MPEAVELRAKRDWRELAQKIAPSRWHWLALLCGPTSYLLIVSMLAVAVAKWTVMGSLQGIDVGVATWLCLIASDITLHLFLVAIFAVGEARSPRLLAATIPLTLLVTALACINALYLTTTGEQLTFEAFTVGIERSEEVFGILAEEQLFTLARLVGALLLLGLPILAWHFVRRRSPIARERGRGRAQAAAVVAAPFLLVSLLAPTSSFMPLRQLEGNATLATYWEWAMADDELLGPAPGEENIWFQGYVPERLASQAAVAKLAAPPNPNVLFVVLESTRWDHTSLAGEDAHATTPNLLALAQRGTVAQQARAVIPHTSKSLFTILCGRLPMMQRRNLEAAANAPLQCLPALLAEAGYQSIFMQSALGSFEDRPRLVERLGYQDFWGWEDIQGTPLGYLASDDASLAPALERWLDGRDSQGPFLATLLTSSTHHPYRLTKTAQAEAEARGAATGSDQERYARLVEEEDAMLGALDEILVRRGLKKNTIVIVVGDHGEGFGANGVKQHDNNFYEEGLRVPLVIAGPGVPNRSIDHGVSLLDIVPTVLEVLGHTLEAPVSQALLGTSILGPVSEHKRSYFACYFDEYCFGYVEGTTKLIIAKGRSVAWYYDLASDPRELESKELTASLRATLPELFQIVNGHLSPEQRLLLPLRNPFGEWRCEENQGCRHPKSPERFFTNKHK